MFVDIKPHRTKPLVQPEDDVDDDAVYLGPDKMQGVSGPGLGGKKRLYFLPLFAPSISIVISTQIYEGFKVTG